MIIVESLKPKIDRTFLVERTYPGYCERNELYECGNMTSTIVTTLRYKTRSIYAPAYFPSLNNDL